jgi:hypothetical protein
VGTASNIAIAVSDTKANATLAAFSITVTQASNGSVTLDWDAPTTNTDGARLTDLAGYQIYYGPAANALRRSVRFANAGVTTYVVTNLTPGTWYFALSTYNAAGAASARSAPATGVVPGFWSPDLVRLDTNMRCSHAEATASQRDTALLRAR